MYGKNPAYKSVKTSETIPKIEVIVPEDKKPSLQFFYNWFF
mgnify:CR=1 FL=1|jgi:hypothetical protein